MLLTSRGNILLIYINLVYVWSVVLVGVYNSKVLFSTSKSEYIGLNIIIFEFHNDLKSKKPFSK